MSDLLLNLINIITDITLLKMKDSQHNEDSKLADKAIQQLRQRANQLISEQNSSAPEKMAGRKYS